METREPVAAGVPPLADRSLDEVTGSSAVVLVEFVTEWCGACRRMAPILESVAAETDAAVVTVDVASNLETAIEYGAQGTPTFVLFVDGRPTKRLRGARTEETLLDLIEPYLG